MHISAEQLQSHVTQKGAMQHFSCKVSKKWNENNVSLPWGKGWRINTRRETETVWPHFFSLWWRRL